jgi:Flp pilus assembly protein TadG
MSAERTTGPSLLRCRRAASAVEFAIIAPVFLAMLFGIISFGAYLALVHDVQQIAAEAARASVAGLSDGERAALARDNIAANAAAYPILEPARLTLVSAVTDPATNVFAVTLSYDASNMVLLDLTRLVPVLPAKIVRAASIKRGGF